MGSWFQVPVVWQWAEEVSLLGISCSKLMWGQQATAALRAWSWVRLDKKHVFSEISKSLSNPCPIGPQAKPEKQVPPVIKGQGRGNGAQRGQEPYSRSHSSQWKNWDPKPSIQTPSLAFPPLHWWVSDFSVIRLLKNCLKCRFYAFIPRNPSSFNSECCLE